MFFVAVLSKNILTLTQKQNFRRFTIYENEGGCVENVEISYFHLHDAPPRGVAKDTLLLVVLTSFGVKLSHNDRAGFITVKEAGISSLTTDPLSP